MREFESIKKDIIPILEDHEVTRASLFGSTVGGPIDEESDIDILVELKDGKSLFDLIRLKNDLEKQLGKEVDLVTYDSLHHLIKDKVLSQKRDIL
ncbi:nucleotidyltransferase family protein [Candidatus Bipolaricaulota bacterium]|nr:nucleotidyltransferase family protein [Candidatus Bipolaricaulota bacterium]